VAKEGNTFKNVVRMHEKNLGVSEDPYIVQPKKISFGAPQKTLIKFFLVTKAALTSSGHKFP